MIFINLFTFEKHFTFHQVVKWSLLPSGVACTYKTLGIDRTTWTQKATHWLTGTGPCITNAIATCRKNFSQWERSFLWKLRYHWLEFLRRVAKTLVIQGPGLHPVSLTISPHIIKIYWKIYCTLSTECNWSLQMFAHVMTALLSCHVQKFVVIFWPSCKQQHPIISVRF